MAGHRSASRKAARRRRSRGDRRARRARSGRTRRRSGGHGEIATVRRPATASGVAPMNDARVDDLLRDLEGELSIEPSPQLVARVRARIDDRSRSTSLIPAWTAGIALTLLMTAIALGIAPDRQTGKSSSAPARTQGVQRVTDMPAPP